VLIFLAILVDLNAEDFALVEELVFAHLLAMITMLVPLTHVLKELEEMAVFTPQSAAMITMLAPMIFVIPQLDADILT